MVLKRAVEAWPQVAAAFTRAELLAAAPEGDSVLAAVRRSFNAERSGDVQFVLKPYIIDRRAKGSNHGTPYDYDCRVPMLWYGPNVPVGVFLQRVGTDQVAPTLAALLRIPPPPQALAPRMF